MKAFAVLGLLLCGAAANAQQGSTIKAEARIVVVDAIVTGRHDELVRDLSSRDFRVWEDNKEQTLQSVVFERRTGSAHGQPRHTVLFFAGAQPSANLSVRQAVARFIDANVDSQSRIAVTSYGGGLRIEQNFTTDAERLKESLDRAVSYANATGNDAVDAISAAATLARSMEALEGSKSIVLLSEGLPQSLVSKARLAEAIDACNRSGVAVYTVDLRSSADSILGVSATSDERSSAPVNLRNRPRLSAAQKDEEDASAQNSGTGNEQMLSRLATETGGFLVSNVSDLQRSLQKIGEEQSEYYSLTYTPAARELRPGVCHALRVKVNRGGTKVRARASYCETKPVDWLAGTVKGEDLERRAATSQAGATRGSMQVSYIYTSPTVARVYLAMDIPAESLMPGKGDVDFVGTALTLDDAVAARFSDTVSHDNALHYAKEFRIQPGKYKFTIAFASGEKSIGKLQAPLEIQPTQTGALALSGLILSRDVHAAGTLADSDASGEPLVTTDGVRIVPAGSSNFGRSETGFFYFEAYAADASSTRVEVRVLDSKSGTVKWDSGPARLNQPPAGGNTLRAAAALPLSQLEAGSYTLEVTAADASRVQVRRTAEFNVF